MCFLVRRSLLKIGGSTLGSEKKYLFLSFAEKNHIIIIQQSITYAFFWLNSKDSHKKGLEFGDMVLRDCGKGIND